MEDSGQYIPAELCGRWFDTGYLGTRDPIENMLILTINIGEIRDKSGFIGRWVYNGCINFHEEE
jgi:hypothetical protein